MRNDYGPDWSYRNGKLPRQRLVFPGLNLVVAMLALLIVIGVPLAALSFMVWALSGAK